VGDLVGVHVLAVLWCFPKRHNSGLLSSLSSCLDDWGDREEMCSRSSYTGIKSTMSRDFQVQQVKEIVEYTQSYIFLHGNKFMV